MTPESIAALIGGAGGFIARQFVENAKRVHSERMAKAEATEASLGAARGFAGMAASILRGVLVGIVAISFLAVLAAGFLDIPVVIESETTKRFMFWSKTYTEYVELHGVPFLKENRLALTTMLFFLFGQAIK